MGYWQKAPYGKSELKSAIQKYIRRAEVEKAQFVGYLMGSHGDAFPRRIPMIAAEDVRWEYTEPTIRLVKSLDKEPDLFNPESVDRPGMMAAIAGWLAGVQVKSRDMASLMGMARDSLEREPFCGFQRENSNNENYWRDCLTQTDEIEAARFLLTAYDTTDKNLAWYMAVKIGSQMEVAPDVLAMNYRHQTGLFYNDDKIMLMGVLMAIRHGKRIPVTGWQDLKPIKPTKAYPLDWYCFDKHTGIGKRAYGYLKAKGVDIEGLDMVQFFCESSKMGPQTDDRITPDYVRSKHLAYGSWERTKEVWEKDLRGKVKMAIEKIMAQSYIQPTLS